MDCPEVEEEEVSPPPAPKEEAMWTTVPTKYSSQVKTVTKTASEAEDFSGGNYFEGLLKRQAFKKSVLSKAISAAPRAKQGVAPKAKKTVVQQSTVPGSSENCEPDQTKTQRKNKLRAE